MKTLFLFIFFVFSVTQTFAKEKVVLQLKWFHQFQFAGYYAAKEKGFYNDVGLDVEIKQRDLKINNIKEVIDNKAQYGIADSILFLYKQKNEPVVIIAPIFQHSPSVLVSRKDSKISSAYDLDKKKMLFYPHDSDGFSILALLKKFNSNPELIRVREKDDYYKLIDKKVDLMPAYITNEPFLFKEKNVDINIINPTNYGIDIYGDMLFTNKQEALNHPNRVKKFKEASLKGWRYALENSDEIIKLIKKKYNSQKSLEHLKYEAAAVKSLISKETTPVGYVDKGRVKFISELYKDFSLLNDNINIDDFIFEDYISNKNLNLSKEEKEFLQNTKTIRVQGQSSFPPYNYEINNKSRGYAIEYVQRLSEVLGTKVEIVQTKSWAKSLEMLKEGAIDLIPNIAINKERLEYIDYTNFSHINFQGALAVRKNSNIKSMKDLENKTIAILNNTFYEELVRKNYPLVKILEVNTTKNSLEAVSNGEADAAIGELSSLEYFVNNNWLSNIKTLKLNKNSKLPTTTALYMGVKKGNSLLISILEKANSTLNHNEITKLKAEWLIKSFNENVHFTQKQNEYLSNKKSINYCIDPNWMPFDKIENNKHIGLSSEYIKIFQEKLGLNFNLLNTKTWSETLEKFKNGSCELIPFISQTKSREEYANFSKTNVSFPLVLATSIKTAFIDDLKKLNGKKIAYVKDYAYKEMLQEKYPKIKFVKVSSINQGLKKLQDNEVYAMIGLLPTLGYEIQKEFSSNVKISGEIKEAINLVVATNKNEAILNEIINLTLDSISQSKKEKLFNEWSLVTYETEVDYQKILIVIAISIIIIFIIVYKNRQINTLYKDMKKYTKIIDEHVLTSTTDAKGNITQVSNAFCKISGYTKEELLGQNHRIIRHPDMSEEFFENLWKQISNGKTWNGEIKNRAKDGSFYWVSANISPVFDKNNNIISYTAIRHEITDKKRVEEISITDELTGLYNRRHFNEVFKNEVNRSKREENYFALVIFDVDCFKQYNDNYGHQKGDYVLEEIGKAVKSLTKRSSDFGFRIGGEEFAIIFKPHFKENALEFAQAINEQIRNLAIEHRYNKADKYVTVSIGLYVEFGEKIENCEAIYNYADNALYQAKENGRNKFVLYKKED